MAKSSIKNPFNKNTHPYCHSGFTYAIDVVEGRILANRYVIGACKRSIREILTSNNPFWHFSPDRAERYLRLVQRFNHVEGNWETKNIVFAPWQNWVWMNVQGFVNNRTKKRRFRHVHIDVARGAGKSTMASQALLFDLAMDEPNGNMISTFATKTSQAKIVLNAARQMALKNKGFLKKFGIEVRAQSIIHKDSGSEARAMSSKADTLDGLKDILAVCDELHAMKRTVFEVITSGMSKRHDSLVLCITTAGSDSEAVGYEENVYAKKICLGEAEDDTRFAVVYTLDKDDDIFDEKNWIKANPNLGVSPDWDTMRSKAAKAKEVPADLPNFKIKHLNMWTEDAESYFSTDAWDKCARRGIRREDFKGVPVKSAVDLSARLDFTVRIDIFKKDGIYYLFENVWLPEATIKSKKDGNDKYQSWVDEGWLIQKPGEVISYQEFGDDFKKFGEEFRLKQAAYDPWKATELAQRLNSSFEMIEYRQNVQHMSEPMKKFDALMRDGKIVHTGSPLMRWCLMNVVAKEDHNRNVYPRKAGGHVKLKIDPMVASIMAIGLWQQEAEISSIYETRGIRTF